MSVFQKKAKVRTAAPGVPVTAVWGIDEKEICLRDFPFLSWDLVIW